MRGFFLICLCSLLCLFYVAPEIHAAHADDALDLRGKITDFSKSTQEKRWKVEDDLTHRERLFQDGLTQEYRETVSKALDQLKSSPDWKQAQRAYRDQIRSKMRELRQKVRVHRDEFDLSFLAISNQFDKDLKDFLAPLEDEFKQNKSDAYQKAQSDFDSAKDDLKEDLRGWKDNAKNLKTSSDFFSNY